MNGTPVFWGVKVAFVFIRFPLTNEPCMTLHDDFSCASLLTSDLYLSLMLVQILSNAGVSTWSAPPMSPWAKQVSEHPILWQTSDVCCILTGKWWNVPEPQFQLVCHQHLGPILHETGAQKQTRWHRDNTSLFYSLYTWRTKEKHRQMQHLHAVCIVIQFQEGLCHFGFIFLQANGSLLVWNKDYMYIHWTVFFVEVDCIQNKTINDVLFILLAVHISL